MSISVAIRHAFGGFTLDVAFQAEEGVTALFGRSGSGKTSVINVVAGLLGPQRGRVVVAGKVLLDTEQRICLPVHKRRIGYVFQEGRLFPHLSVRQNLAYGQRFAPRRAKPETWGHVVSMLGIDTLLARRPSALSGGEKQRVSIGRALLSSPDMLLMDEPLAALDDARKTEILPFLNRLRDETKIPILYVSHSVAEVARIADSVVFLKDGKLVRTGRASDLLSDPDTAPALGLQEDAGAVLRGRILRHTDDGLSEIAFSGGTLILPARPEAIGSQIHIWIRARDVMLSLAPLGGVSALNILPATVLALRRGEGPGVMVQLQTGEARILSRITRRSAKNLGLKPGMQVYGVVKSVSVAKENVG